LGEPQSRSGRGGKDKNFHPLLGIDPSRPPRSLVSTLTELSRVSIDMTFLNKVHDANAKRGARDILLCTHFIPKALKGFRLNIYGKFTLKSAWTNLILHRVTSI